ncbi:MAG: hypothetical protein JM58_13200 [Peptococcaceae bacterium BICA1-8]|nr:MAG: hypothetical protein JM58_13200 [Peptococcaceae bacterium BICA1-8]
MRITSKLFILALVSLLVFTLVAGCGNKPVEQKDNAGETKSGITEEFISIGTSSSGGLFNSLGVAVGQLWTEKITGVKFSAQVTGGSGENSINIGAKKLDLAIVSGATAYEAVTGIEKFEGKKISNMKAIASLYPAVIQIPVLKDSGINNILDIKGKKVNIGQAGSGSEATSISFLTSFGVKLEDFNPQRLSHSNASDAVIDEKMEGYINIGGLGQGHQMKAMSTGKFKIISLEPADLREKFLADFPYYFPFTIKAGVYSDQDYEVKTVASSTLLVAREDLSEELVYQITKNLFENVKELAKTQSIANEITLESALNGIKIPLHPGAERYFKEVGVIK